MKKPKSILNFEIEDIHFVWPDGSLRKEPFHAAKASDEVYYVAEVDSKKTTLTISSKKPRKRRK